MYLLREGHQTERQISHDNAYIWNTKNDVNELLYKAEQFTDTENKLMVNRGNGREQRD